MYMPSPHISVPPHLSTHSYTHNTHPSTHPSIHPSIHPSNICYLHMPGSVLGSGNTVSKANIGFPLVKLALCQLYMVFIQFAKITLAQFMKTANKKT